MSQTLLKFLDFWQSAIERRNLADLPPDVSKALEAPLDAESLAEAHRLAMKGIKALRTVSDTEAERTRKIAFKNF